MNRVVPVINCLEEDGACVTEKLNILRQFSDRAHVDIADGTITPGKNWSDPAMWKKEGEGIGLEVHLMVKEPEVILDDWLNAGAKRVIVHFEAGEASTAERLQKMEAKCAQHEATLVLGMSLEATVEAIMPLAAIVNDFCVMAVHLGPTGQPFDPSSLEKIRALRAALPQAHIEVDGGMNAETARQAYQAGADQICAGAYIFKNEDPKRAANELQLEA